MTHENLSNERTEREAYAPEGKLVEGDRKMFNKGELFPHEHNRPVDPLKDELTRQMSHKGGMASPLTEHY
jgi:hypothetical protein